MFGFVADILTSAVSILLPVFFSYKALRTSDPAVLTPWLMYWTTLSLFIVAENQLDFILSWVPFYSWMRLGLHLYLVLPGQQGSMLIYREYIHPFLEEHERQIDRMISDAHAKAKAAGMDAVKRAIEYVRVQILGQPPRQPTPPPSRSVSYTTHLFNRFTMPSAREGLAVAGTSDLFGLLGKALQQTAYGDSHSRDAQAEDLVASGTLIPSDLAPQERTAFINTQRARLQTLLQAFDTEAYNAADAPATSQSRSSTARPAGQRKTYLAPSDTGSSGSGNGRDKDLHRSRSESEFEDLAFEPMPDPEQYRSHDYVSSAVGSAGRFPGGSRQEGSGWNNWVWGNHGEKDSVLDPRKDQ